jgi:hypothetical protein
MKKFMAIIFSAITIFVMVVAVFAIAIIDENGNIIQENEPLPGGIMTTSGVLEPDALDLSEYDPSTLPAFDSVTGKVVEFWISDFSVFARLSIPHEDETGTTDLPFDLRIDDNTFFLGEPPEVGETITGFYDNTLPVAMIYPPQMTAVVVVNRDEELPRVIVDRFNYEWVSTDAGFRLNINEDTQIVFQNGDPFEGEKDELIGRKLVVEFSISHRDIPETIPNPEKITILYERAVHPIGDIGGLEFDANIWENFEWQGYTHNEKDWSEYEIIITINKLSRGVPNAKIITNGWFYSITSAFSDGTAETLPPNGTVHVPLRAVTEMLGFIPRWNAASREVTVGSPRGEISFIIDGDEYTLTTPGGIVTTCSIIPPIIEDGRTYVPLAFFRDVFGFTNAWKEGGQVYLDNAERME